MNKRGAVLESDEKALVASALVAMTSDMPPDVAEAVSGHLASIVAKLELAETITTLFAQAKAVAETGGDEQVG